MVKLKIYLGDLTYNTIVVSTEALPINIGYIASYCKKRFGSEVEFTLFKYHQELEKAILESPPDILGLSNYVWCQNLSHEMFKIFSENIRLFLKSVKPLHSRLSVMMDWKFCWGIFSIWHMERKILSRLFLTEDHWWQSRSIFVSAMPIALWTRWLREGGCCWFVSITTHQKWKVRPTASHKQRWKGFFHL